MRISVLLVDDQYIVREALRALLDHQPDLTVVGEAADGLEAVEAVAALKPDVLVTELMLPGLHGLDVAEQSMRRSPRTQVLVLSTHADELPVRRALRRGVKGYVAKDSSTVHLLEGIREAAAGRPYLCPRTLQAAIDSLESSGAEPPGEEALDRLTVRERQVLQLAAEGATHAEVAARLFISQRTAEIHRHNLMRKLGLRRQADLVRYAITQGVLPLDRGGTRHGRDRANGTRADGSDTKVT